VAHRLVPWPVVEATIRRRAEREWRTDEAARDGALHLMAFLLGATPRAGEVESAARAFLAERHLRMERLWRPWLTTRQDIADIDRLRQFVGRGALLTFLHHGMSVGAIASIGAHGIPLCIPASARFFEPSAQGVRAVRKATLLASGARFVPAADSFDPLRHLLDDGAVVAVAIDVPGETAVPFLGRRIGLRAGVARLAVATGAPVLTLSPWRTTHLQRLTIGGPLHPAQFPDSQALLAEILRLHEAAVLAWPEAVEPELWRQLAADWSAGTRLESPRR
jgi:lauroyl/myristoyl acyltransferase